MTKTTRETRTPTLNQVAKNSHRRSLRGIPRRLFLRSVVEPPPAVAFTSSSAQEITGQAQAIAKQGNVLVHCLAADATTCNALRRSSVSADVLHGSRLPYTDNLVNLLIVNEGSQIPKDELLRVLVPNGVAVVGGQKIVKPWPKEIDEWTHYLHDASGNPVRRTESRAAAATAMGQRPRWCRSHEVDISIGSRRLGGRPALQRFRTRRRRAFTIRRCRRRNGGSRTNGAGGAGRVQRGAAVEAPHSKMGQPRLGSGPDSVSGHPTKRCGRCRRR